MSTGKSQNCPLPKGPPPRPPKKKPKSRKPRPRPAQHRRHEWEDAGGMDDAGNWLPEPRLWEPAGRLTDQSREARVEVLRRRHELKQRLSHPLDTAVPPDYAGAMVALARLMREEALGERGFRWCAEGVSVVPPASPGDPPRYRAEVWDGGEGKAGDHIHLGYADSEGEAIDLILDWCQKRLRINASYRPPAWFQTLLFEANGL